MNAIARIGFVLSLIAGLVVMLGSSGAWAFAGNLLEEVEERMKSIAAIASGNKLPPKDCWDLQDSESWELQVHSDDVPVYQACNGAGKYSETVNIACSSTARGDKGVQGSLEFADDLFGYDETKPRFDIPLDPDARGLVDGIVRSADRDPIKVKIQWHLLHYTHFKEDDPIHKKWSIRFSILFGGKGNNSMSTLKLILLDAIAADIEMQKFSAKADFEVIAYFSEEKYAYSGVGVFGISDKFPLLVKKCFSSDE
ncbi:MAG: hypothetical protein ISN28_09160 [Ectothiorhodospiraceae bacterium AqS1]|nr:hypothetical protein [Ectothiorhodospiraceae bacterium AqS1]